MNAALNPASTVTNAVTAAGETYCWGQKFTSKLGDPVGTSQTAEPTRVGQVMLRAPTQ